MDDDADELATLWAAYEDGELDDAGAVRLAGVLADDPERRRTFLDAHRVHLEALGALAPLDIDALVAALRRRRRRRSRPSALLLVTGAAIAASLVVVLLWHLRTASTGDPVLREGRVTLTDGVLLTAGTPLPIDRDLCLADGAMVIVDDPAGRLTLAGAATFRRRSDRDGFDLSAGHLDVRFEATTPSARWALRTAHAEATVVGTRFAVTTAAEGSWLRVTEGRVRWHGPGVAVPRKYDAGETAWAIDAAACATLAGTLMGECEQKPSSSTVAAVFADPAAGRGYFASRSVWTTGAPPAEAESHRESVASGRSIIRLPLPPITPGQVIAVRYTYAFFGDGAGTSRSSLAFGPTPWGQDLQADTGGTLIAMDWRRIDVVLRPCGDGLLPWYDAALLIGDYVFARRLILGAPAEVILTTEISGEISRDLCYRAEAASVPPSSR